MRKDVRYVDFLGPVLQCGMPCEVLAPGEEDSQSQDEMTKDVFFVYSTLVIFEWRAYTATHNSQG